MKRILIGMFILILLVMAGCSGDAGPRGFTGSTGPSGFQGKQGIQGQQGIQGEQGVQGERGLIGATGAKGEQGKRGERGLQGIPGIPAEPIIYGGGGGGGTNGVAPTPDPDPEPPEPIVVAPDPDPMEAGPVKTKFMCKATDIAGGRTVLDITPAVIWTPSGNVTIIGIFMTAVINPLASFTQGRLLSAGEIVVVPQRDVDGILAHCETALVIQQVTIGDTTAIVAVGEVFAQHTVMFPAGYGVDLNNGESLYLNCFFYNSMSNKHNTHTYAQVYYIGR